MGFNDLDSNNWANFIYLSLLLIALVSSVIFRSNLKASALIKQAFLWAIVILLIIIAYSFKYDFYNLKNRILTELFPSKAVSTGNDQIIINISNDGHFYVDLLVNEKPVRFIVDTGASDIALSASDAKRLGIDINKLSFSKEYQTANGRVFGASVNLKEVRIADLVFYDVGASVSSSNMGTSLLGMSFLRRFKKYEFDQDSLILTY